MTWAVAFLALFGFVFLAFWWSGSAIRYGAGRVTDSVGASYQVAGSVADKKTGKPVPWAEVQTDFASGPQFYSTTADRNGEYALLTLPERHRLIVRANGYHAASITVGRQWFAWLPHGSERRNVELTPE